MAELDRMLTPGDPADRWISITRWILGGSFGLLVVTACTLIVIGPARPLGLFLLVLVAVVGAAAGLQRRFVAAQDRHRRNEAETFARILQGLSRSVSPSAIVDAMLADLGRVSAADHCVVVRIEAGSATPIATLVSMHPGLPSTTVGLPIAALGGGTGEDPERLIERLAESVETVFGIGNTLAVPLRHEGAVIGAIILSRRSAEPWPPATRRVLGAAAQEASAALSRVDSTRAVEAQASTDPLTGLPNRRYFEEFWNLLGQRRRLDDDPAVGVLMVDIDWFKRVNDTFGHDVGDEVLRAVGGAIAAAVRDGDVPARFGGEEFAILLRNATLPVAIEVAERVRRAVEALDLEQWRVPAVSVSVGVAVGSRRDQSIGELLAAADRALYRAKRAGRNQVVAV